MKGQKKILTVSEYQKLLNTKNYKTKFYSFVDFLTVVMQSREVYRLLLSKQIKSTL